VKKPRDPLGLAMERALWNQGYRTLAGLDEAGRGAWAGPVVAAAVVLPPHDADLHLVLHEVHDSKQLAPSQRERLVPVIQCAALSVGVGLATPAEVDQCNVLEATRLAMVRAIQELILPPDFLLLDHLTLPQVATEQKPISHGDACILSIAAASVVAKVFRDRLMVQLSEDYPGYDLEHNKGYGTPRHRQALACLGPTDIHRRSYRPVAELGRER